MRRDAHPFDQLRGLLISICISLILTGCYAYRVQAPEHEGVATGHKVVWSYLWGLVQQQPAVDNCQGQGLAIVTVKTTPVYELLTFVTLGLISAKQVTWECDQGCAQAGTFSTDSVRTVPKAGR